MNATNWVSITNYTCGDVIALRLKDLHQTCSGTVVVVLGYIIPVLAFLVIISNSLIIAVFLKPRMRSHTTMILSLIACVDMLNIICPSASYVYYYVFNNYTDFFRYPVCKIAYFLTDTWVNMLNMISLWLTVMLAYVRSKCLKSPFDARRFHSGRRIVVYVTGIIIMAFSIHLPAFFLFRFFPLAVHDPQTNNTNVVCGIREANVTFHVTICAGRKLHVLIETVLDSLIPCSILAYYSIIMHKTLKEANKCRNSLCQSKNKQAVNICTDDNKQVPRTTGAKENDVTCSVPDEEPDGESENNGTCKIFHLNKNRSWIKSAWTKMSERKHLKETISNDTAFEKLDRDSRRTSCIILMLVSILILHEIPLSLMTIYVLIKHYNLPLPLNFYGCLHVVKLLGQYITYPAIFLMYTCMSSAFRAEICHMFPFTCRRQNLIVTDSNKAFMSPCTLRKITTSGDSTFHDSDDSSDDM